MNSKLLVFAFLLMSTGCAHSPDVAKTDMPEDEMSTAGGRMPASVTEGDADNSGKKQDCKDKEDCHGKKCSHKD